MLRFLAACVMVAAVSAYSSGAPETACETLIPNHGAEPQGSDTNPYRLDISREAVAPGGLVNGKGMIFSDNIMKGWTSRLSAFIYH